VPVFGPVSRRDLIRNLKKLGFEGPYKGKKHDFMVKGDLTPRIPNPHRGDISRDLLGRILEQAGVSKEEWRGL
jgi:predicted RNA binding protein YcfA (HicA-like mRNA interferase family)